MSSLAVLADIHGNSLALDAVLADIDRRGITRIVNLGDAVYGSLDAAGTVDRLRSRGIVSISGNGDRLFGDPPTAPDVQAAVAAMGPERLRWLTGLPATLVLDGIFLCHGTPADDTVYLLERVTEQGLGARPLADVAALVAGVAQQVILCGHSHLPRTALLPDGRLVANPGSVGLPAYSDEVPHPHVVENLSPHARYAILSGGAEGWRVEHVAVPYPWSEAAAAARRRGRPDRAAWLETGRARS